ncbi:hypothetical protein D3C76_1325050 [compost metagenome]
MGFEIGPCYIGTAQVTQQVCLQHLFMRFKRRLLEAAHCANACIVDPDVDASVAEGSGVLCQGAHLLATRDVGAHGQCRSATCRAFLDNIIQGGFVARSQYQACSLVSKRVSRCTAYPT